MDFALRHNGLPSLTLWERLLPHSPGLYVHEDNQAMIRVVESGRNPTMRYIGRTHGISVAWLHEQFQKEELTLAYELSSRMCADIFTKGFTEADKWSLVCSLICVINPADIGELTLKTGEIVEDPDGLLQLLEETAAEVKFCQDEMKQALGHLETLCALHRALAPASHPS